jgi:ribosomal protein L37E
MPKPRGRHHFPCRRCGEAHTNPASSTICDVCGSAEHSIELLNKAAYARAQREEEARAQPSVTDAYVIEVLRQELGIAMGDAVKFLKAFRICAENTKTL